ncbi:MAG: undecaprenyl/decaprenyl-phosphate alpha-N-acetylglucosaminyl 1-phosphate transferase [Verrucomicrobiales bacterium]|nr:undecaprenyl/decaprenyl-phosphate alpha-N-acetylglucosaminyl 1-phosphate transferase [Verrucomicrobiales bacterium]
MRTYFTMLLLAMVVTFVMTPIAGRIAALLGAVDLPGPRKIHTEPIARLGGLAVVAGFCAPLIALYFLDNRVAQIFQQNQMLIIALVGAGILTFLLGVVDDVRGLAPRWKLLGQFGVATLMYGGGFRITEFSNPFGGAWQLGWLAFPVTLLWIVGLTNATNLLDGMDGLAAGVAAVLAVSLSMISILDGNSVLALMTFCLAGAALGFLPYNFAPARIFLGDCGSLFLGVTMAGISTISLFKAATATLVMVPMLLFALPLYDTAHVVFHRLSEGRHPFSADKNHVHLRLLRLGLNQREAALFLYLVTLFLGLAAIILSWRLTSGVFAGLSFSGLLLALSLGLWSWRLRERRGKQKPPL